MALSLDAAAEVFREAMRDTVKRYSLWYLIQGILLIAAGMLAIIYPVISSAAVVVLLGWLLIITGVVQGLSLIGAGQVLDELARYADSNYDDCTACNRSAAWRV